MTDCKKFSCSNCNHFFEAYPPDDVYTKARVKECFICKHTKKTQIKRTVECENCDHQNILYWHTQYLHTVGEEKTAKINRDKELGVALEDSFVRKRITLDRD